MLFSEPKIPQLTGSSSWILASPRFSALQRAENSSRVSPPRTRLAPAAFQCSSASRKFLIAYGFTVEEVLESVSVLFSEPKIPQLTEATRILRLCRCFSALQRAENSSRRRTEEGRAKTRVSVLFSEPKIPHDGIDAQSGDAHPVSVLFSEPKIPHWRVERQGQTTVAVSVLFSEPKIPPSITPSST